MVTPPSPLPPAADAVPLDPLLRVEADARRARRPYRVLGLAEVRRNYREIQMGGSPGPAIAAIEDDAIGDRARTLPVRIYRPMKTPRPPLVIYFHGGGFVIGDLDTHDRNTRGIAAATGATVVSVAYRLAPEHPFPAAPDDAMLAVRGAPEIARRLGADTSRIFVAGDSAGATLALVAAIAARDTNGTRLAGVVAIYPGVSRISSTATASALAFGDGNFGLSNDDIAWFREQYLPDKASHEDWRAAPALVPNLAGLPPTFIVVAAYDALRDEGIAFAERLRDSGVAVELRVAAGMNHGFMGAPKPPAAVNDTLRAIGQWMSDLPR